MIHWEPWYLDIPLVERERIDKLPPKLRNEALKRHYWQYVEKVRSAKENKKPLDKQQTLFGNPPENVPPWVRKALKNNWNRLSSTVPEEALPVSYLSNLLGCGHYGCVFSTDSNWVFKITSDETEARFVAKALELAAKEGWPNGIVQYGGIVELEGTHRSRPIYGLWRESASDVGETLIYRRDMDNYKLRNIEESREALSSFMYSASIVRHYNRKGYSLQQMKDGPVIEVDYIPKRDSINTSLWGILNRSRGLTKAATAYHYLSQIPLHMENMNPLIAPVGDALGYYLDKDIILADVHTGNLGFVNRPDYTEPVLVITDPGHAFGNL